MIQYIVSHDILMLATRGSWGEDPYLSQKKDESALFAVPSVYHRGRFPQIKSVVPKIL